MSTGSRRMLSILGLIVTFVLVVASCSPGGAPGGAPTQAAGVSPGAAKPAGTSPSTTPVSAAPKSGGFLNIIQYQEPPHWDSHQANFVIPLDWFISQPLVTYDDGGAIRPRLLDKWEYTDPKTLLLHIQDGARWQDTAPVDGREFTAEDVIYNIKRLATPGWVWSSRFEPIDKMEVVDKSTVRVVFKDIYAPFMRVLGYICHQMYPKESIEKNGDMKNPANHVGTGGFKLKEYTQGIGGSVVKDPNFWVKGKPYLDGARLNIVNDKTTLMAAYRTGKGDYTPFTGAGEMTGREMKELKRSNPEIVFKPIGNSFPIVFAFPLNKKPFDDIRVRKAIDLATDRQAMLDIVLDGGGHICGPLSPKLFPGWTFSEEELLKMPGYRQPKDQDIAEAKRLMAEAGLAGGISIKADASSYADWLNQKPMEVAKSQLAKIGIDIKITMYDRAAFFDMDTRREFDFRSRGYVAGVEPDDQLYSRHHSTGSRNYQNFKDPVVDELLDKQRRTLDTEERKKLIRQAQEKIIESVPQVFLMTIEIYPPMQPWVKGLEVNVDNRIGIPENVWIAK